MKIKFKRQNFQHDAVNSVVDVFKGQSKKNITYSRNMGLINSIERELTDENLFYGVKNNEIELGKAHVLNNINEIQKNNNIELSFDLVDDIGFCSLDVSMETGTGKTYVYLKTIHELYSRYGWSKYIIIVPTVAIREGVLNSIKLTEQHFVEIYKRNIHAFVYDSKNLHQIDNYSSNSDINVMIINIQAFNSKENKIIYNKRDDFKSRRPIDIIAANNPILILDEPQRMGGQATMEALKEFNPLFLINYSATHVKKNNLIYVLDTIDAYEKKLIKKIEVIGVSLNEVSTDSGYIYFKEIILSDSNPEALIEIEVYKNKKEVKRKTVKVKKGSDLEEISKGLKQYENYIVASVNAIDNTITFTNGISINLGFFNGSIDNINERRIQIRETIKTHLKKEEFLFRKNIKTMSLFFIDSVAMYRQYDESGNKRLGIYGKIFEEEYIEIVKSFIKDIEDRYGENDPYITYLKDLDTDKIHNGYFSIDKKSNKYIDSYDEKEKDPDAYDLILRNKEKLLSMEEPTRFIFSHSALREGWDNPNVFQICTLKDSNSKSDSDISKHQEVGRGLRLCVDNDGNRMDYSELYEDIFLYNTLTVITSGKYEEYVKTLQDEMFKDLYDRPTSVESDYFKNKPVIEKNTTINSKEADSIMLYLAINGYIDKDFKITNKYLEDLKNNSLCKMEGIINGFDITVHSLIGRIISLDNISKYISKAKNQDENKINKKNFELFRELWNKINDRYYYYIDFNIDEIISSSIKSINKNLDVTRLFYLIQAGIQEDNIDNYDLKNNTGFLLNNNKFENIEHMYDSTKYDLLGEICNRTSFGRRTIASILIGINDNKFNMYKMNPHEFFQNISEIINESFAKYILDNINDKGDSCISYSKIDNSKYDDSIFKEFVSNQNKVIDSLEKHIKEKLVYDSNVEKNIAESMEKSEHVLVYAKLPRAYKISTPVGNYSPDWAILFKNKNNNKDHIYFVAESKGSTSDMDLRFVEKAKIECAKILYKNYNTENINYSVISSFDDLIKDLNLIM